MSSSAVKFFSLSSGSCGNCYFLSLEEDGEHVAGVVIDAGVSLRRMKRELSLKGYSYDSFSAVLVTHDHLDHIRHLGSYCKHLQKPVYTTPVLHRALQKHSFTSEWIDGCQKDMDAGGWNEIVKGKIYAKYFIVPHDATQTVGYALLLGGYKFVIMTDIGDMTAEALAYARNADTVVIESNFDTGMLMAGPYPYDLKMRICKGAGHLSNDKCAAAIKGFLHDGLKYIFLCHLSENNNTPELAYQASRESVPQESGVSLRTLPRQTASPLYTL